jgi:hypothetical protein
MMLRGYFSHNSPEGLAPWLWLDTVGYDYQYAGENLAIHFAESSDVVRAWVASPKHYENLVKTEYTEMGIGVAHGVMDGRQTVVVVQFFGTPAPNPEPVIVPVAAPVVVRAIQTVTETSEATQDAQQVTQSEPRVAGAVSQTQSNTTQPLALVTLPQYAPEPTFADVLYDNIYEFVVLLLLAFLLGLASLYVVHHYFYHAHLSRVAFGTASLGIASLVLIVNLITTHGGAVIPADIQFAGVAKSLQIE